MSILDWHSVIALFSAVLRRAASTTAIDVDPMEVQLHEINDSAFDATDPGGQTMSTKGKADAIAMLKEDHEKVKTLFTRFEETDAPATKAKIVSETLMELKIHATIEEELFYPALRQEIEDEEGMMDEADEEHHVAKVLVAELEAMDGDEGHWDAKFTVLAESIRHHIKEEEGKMFKEAKKTDIDFSALGSRMAQLKEQLMRDGVPPDAEARMVQQCGLRGDSPAKNAQKKVQVPLKRKAS